MGPRSTTKIFMAFDNLRIETQNPVDGQALVYDAVAGVWKNEAVSGSSTLAGLSDVDLSSLTDGQALVYDAASGKWVNGAAGGGDVVGPASSVDNAIARYNGTTGKLLQGYTSGAPTITDTGEVRIPSLATAAMAVGPLDSDLAAILQGWIDTVPGRVVVRGAGATPFSGIAVVADASGGTGIGLWSVVLGATPFGIVSDVLMDTNGGVAYGHINYIQVRPGIAATTAYGYHTYRFDLTAGASLTNGYAFWSDDQGGAATNAYYLWFDSRGVYRIREDNVADGSGNPQAIPALYNPRFTKYTAGLANYERSVEQWMANVLQIGAEAGGTGTLRGVQIIGASLAISDINIVLGTTTGTKIGTATSQKLGFYNATPIVQGASVADASGGTVIDIEARAALNALISRIEATGLIATV